MSWAQRLAHPGGVLAAVRLAAVPVFFAAERMVAHPEANASPFLPALLLAAVYAAAAFAAELRGRPLAPSAVLTAVDVALIAALVATSGGPFSQLRYAFFVLPVCAAFLLAPRLTAAASAVSVALYALIGVTYPDATDADVLRFELTQVLFLAWMGAAATGLSWLLTRRAREVERLSAGRGRLVAQALDAEDGARRRLAESLHDEALQNLLAARQLLGSRDDDDRALAVAGLDEGVRQIREAVFDLHPYLLERAGLRAALQAVADRAAARAGFTAVVDVDPAAEGVHDQLVFSIARELLANAAKHAAATTVAVRVTRLADAVELVVEDDGRGVEDEQVRRAPLRGHIGLASCAERAEALGGELRLGPGPDGRGTRALATLPAPVHALVSWPAGRAGTNAP